MDRTWRQGLGVFLAAMAFAANYSPWVRAAVGLPDELVLSAGQTQVLETGLPMRVQAGSGAVAVLASGDERLNETSVALCAAQDGETSVTFSLLGLFPVHETHVSVVRERTLIPGGQAVGVALKTQGVLVVAGSSGQLARSALRVGDVIYSVNGQRLDSAKALSQLLNAQAGDSVRMQVLRAGRQIEVEASAPMDETDGQRRLGVWVRDSTAGVGTLSYIDSQNQAYGALGHAIVDADTGDVLTPREGAIMNAHVVDVIRGESGRAGELKGSFLKEGEQMGTLEINSIYGIYGRMNTLPMDLLYPQGLAVGARSTVHTGKASILTTVDELGVQEYSVEIVRCFAQDAPSQKGMILRVTDERLLHRTGGIVQGMSGSPILQDGRIIGAVTHVYLNDAAQGYGMYIEWMLKQSDTLSGVQKDAAA